MPSAVERQRNEGRALPASYEWLRLIHRPENLAYYVCLLRSEPAPASNYVGFTTIRRQAPAAKAKTYVNLILFDPAEIDRPLPAADPRARHIREVLRRGLAETFDCGLVNGPRGRARIESDDAVGLTLSFTWSEAPPLLPEIRLLIGLPRPQTARKILQEGAALGVAGMYFFPTEKGERSYRSSQLWTSGEARRHLLAGVAQAFCTRVPECRVVDSLASALELTGPCPTRVALDNYEATVALTQLPDGQLPAVLAIGGERGWAAAERDQLRAGGFTLAHLGPRVLRTETACAVGLSLLKARLGLL